ncbi:hypothetical protein BST81_15370 [Leptolyngbya sp. 'hensonii']|uniref:DUF11 domain-containing protein n=1 Tax=Leptolyngbya sp. 'hensonii' TaxID=1922337 RepID=UPI00094FA795|nr:DUF11 domain-containing protein [Leptolyngbya sp. 'hensonii']OLP17697.1 hypothetical protein BST81_15370 [Leptolyngbya sp. 'hensonii']
MQRHIILGSGLVTVLTAVFWINGSTSLAAAPFQVSGTGNGAPIVSQKPAQVDLQLLVEKQMVVRDTQGKQQIAWQPLQGNVTVQPGDTLRYSFTGKNTSDRAVKNLAVTQPIPRQMVYLPYSATGSAPIPVKITYSTDNGKTFVETPTIQVRLANGKVQTQPAPPSAYTQIRWTATQPLSPSASFTGSYQVRVR